MSKIFVIFTAATWALVPRPLSFAADIDVESGDASALYQAVATARAGDTIRLNSGTYQMPMSLVCQHSGQHKSPIRVTAAPGAKPVLDFVGNPSVGLDVIGSWWEISGISIVRSGHFGLQISGPSAHDNVVRNVTVSGNGNTGLVIIDGASNNTIVQCDSLLNCNAKNGGEEGDGFGAYRGVGTGNRFISCQSWNNSDDGFDCWDAGNAVAFEQCLAWANGLNLWGIPNFSGDGNGFKLGRGAGSHVLTRCIAWDLPGCGFDLNGNSSGVTIRNCAAMRCRIYNFAMTDSHGNIDKNFLQNNLSIDGRVSISREVKDLTNSWSAKGITPIEASHFKSGNFDLNAKRRTEKGELILGSFLQPKRLSPSVDAGSHAGMPFIGRAPDIGPREYKPFFHLIFPHSRAP